MSVEFRQRSTSEIAQIVKRSKWHILLPTFAFAAAVAWVVWSLPSFYESTTFLTLKPPTISEKVVQSLSSEDLSQRLQNINQTVLSRSSLEPMVAKYKLFESEKASGMPMELIIDRMKKNIKVEPEKTDNEKVAGFRITYRDRSPEAARNVTAELASKYVNAQIVESTQSAETTREFIENQLVQAKNNLDNFEKQRLDIMTQNVETLPESGQGLIAQLEGLRQREQTITKEKETLMTEKGRLNESIRSYNSQIRLIEDFGQKDADNASLRSDYKKTQAYGEMLKRKTELEAKFESVKTQYKPKHPEYIGVQTEIEKVNNQLEAMAKDAKDISMEASHSTREKAAYQIRQIEIERGKLESQIAQINQQLQMKDVDTQQNAGQIALLESKLNTIPNVKVALEAINNQYQSAKQTYEDLLKKRNDANLQVERESNAQGETIRVVDAANLPQSPANASKKPLFVVVGAGIGMALGLFLAGIFEVPRFFRIQNVEDAKHYTGLPVLASVPPLLTHEELSRQKRAHLLKVAVGMGAACASIPLLALGLQASRIFERLIS